MNRTAAALGQAFSLFSTCAVLAQAPARVENRPPLAFREEFTEGTNETPATMASLKNKELRFATYGPGKDMLSKTWHPNLPNQGAFMWTGACTQVCGFTLYLPNDYIDLRGLAKITWRTTQSGLHQLHLLIKTADGKLLVSDQSVGATSDWQVSDLIVQDLRWREVDTSVMNDLNPPGGGAWLPQPDLSKVVEIGFTDLAVGSGHGKLAGSSRVDWIEVYGLRAPKK